ncbi:MAG: RtcB family protein, partial [Cellulomonadaceae bacterium]|nr:RtcB family protein [Cellulomonadaceae bacterium]
LISWASILEPSTREQAVRTASMPFVYPHVALMPDAHLGIIWTSAGRVSPAESKERVCRRSRTAPMTGD